MVAKTKADWSKWLSAPKPGKDEDYIAKGSGSAIFLSKSALYNYPYAIVTPPRVA